ncbi:CPBP family intramembrane glutamic endopeptidase [Streptococcus sp. DD12]|uniref:CPBP family intramembrane glutamic endopeptidase n=1 Tax=Streptococcus sp. DD12 TaxID=1777880 RepID=UPI000835FEF1|nr:CPBP family intramembrane glutamic endopeptidase [Streptococcus sp. DD12]
MLHQINNRILVNLTIATSAVFGFVIIPLLIFKILGYKIKEINLNILVAVILGVAIVGFSYLFLNFVEVAHAFIIATCEELLFRYILFSALLSYYPRRQAIFIGSMLFAVILHLNGDFLANLLIKFPSSIILYLLADRYGIQYSIGLHWFYNVLIGSLS